MVHEIRLISPDNDCEVLRYAWHPCEQMQLHVFDRPVRGNRIAISVKKWNNTLHFQLKFILMTLSGCICPLHSISIWFNLNKSHLSQESKECLARHMGEQIFVWIEATRGMCRKVRSLSPSQPAGSVEDTRSSNNVWTWWTSPCTAQLRDKPAEDGLEKMQIAIKSSLLRHPVKLESNYFLNHFQKYLLDMPCVFTYALKG